MHRLVTLVSLVLLVTSVALGADYVQVQLPIEKLPEEHDYQKQLRAFMATLGEKDFQVEPQTISVVPTDDPEQLYRLWLLQQRPPHPGAATLPAASFTLSAIEGQKGLRIPCAPSECQAVAWLANWDYAGNPYRGSKPLKLRAFMLAAIDVMMLDYLYEHDPRGANRADYLGGNLIWTGYTYQAVQDVLPPEARAGFEAGLKKLVLTINRWGPKGSMTDMDLFAPVGLRYIAQASNDAELKRIAEDYSRRLFTDEHYFNAAGYFVDNGCFDTSYNGISLYFGTWAAVMSDWKFAQDALDRAYRLRAHLSFPSPDGSFSGPSEMASRCSGDPPSDQWDFEPRTHACGMVTDEALHLGPLPKEANLKNAPAAVVGGLNAALVAKPSPPVPGPWRESHWSMGVNFAYEFYRPGDYAKRVKLVQENSPLAKPLYLRDEKFVRQFGKAFVIARLEGFAAAVHTGPVGKIHNDWQRPYGFGGGELCAFWTPATGPVMLGRRRGVQGGVFDSFSEWRTWPVHAVSGATPAGDVVSSTRIEKPTVEIQCGSSSADVRVAGIIPKYVAAKKGCLPTDLAYERRFVIDAAGVKVRTSVKSKGEEKLTELYETIPIFLGDRARQKDTTIHLQLGSDWTEATATPSPNVKLVKLKRFDGEVLITFARPVTLRVSPGIWTDGFQTEARCQTLLVNLLEPGADTVQDVSLEYSISAVPR